MESLLSASGVCGLKSALVNKNVFGELKKALVNYSGF